MKEKISAIYTDSEAEIIAGWVFEHFTGLSKMEMRFDKEHELTPVQNQHLTNALNELLDHKPIQYVLGEAWFCGMKFLVNESVLIPRPETEELVEWIVSESRVTDYRLQIAAGQPSGNSHPLILDIGTGSGCIPISLKTKMPSAEITAVDISSKALLTARQNAINLNAAVNFMELDFLLETGWSRLSNYDFIISNPPYIPIKEKAALDKNVTAWEPGLALFVADNDPLVFYRKIAKFAKRHLKGNGQVFLEIHQDYALQTKTLFDEQGFVTMVKKDINGNDRMIKASF